MDQLTQTLLKWNIPFFEQEPLAVHTTFRIGGATPLFIEPQTEQQIARILQTPPTNLPFYVLGKGSNVLFPDTDYLGVVIHLGQNMSQMQRVDDTTLFCQSGAKLQDFCLFAASFGLTGMEPLYGIPGSVGGAVYMNAGAYGTEIKDIAVSSNYVSHSGQCGTILLEDMDLSYRHSVYVENKALITGLTVRLKHGNRKEIRTKMEDYMQRRWDKQPLEHASAGSTFKRPTGFYASALIDECGLKGMRVGDAMVSDKHAGFVVNVGRATAAEVQELIRQVQQAVLWQKGVQLEPEIMLL